MPSEQESPKEEPIQPALGLAFGLALTVLGVAGLALSRNIKSIGFQDPSDPGPHFFPRVLLTFLVCGGVFEICRHVFYFWKKSSHARQQTPQAEKGSPTPGKVPSESILWIDSIGLALGMSCMVWIMPYAGFPVSASLFLLGFLVRYGIKLPTAIFASAGIVGVIWMIFVWGLSSPLPRGSWW